MKIKPTRQTTVATLAMSKLRNGKVIGTGTVGVQNMATHSAQKEDGSIDFETLGKPAQHEQESLAVCSTIVEALNTAGHAWAQPIDVTREDEDFDCECTDQNDSKRKLFIQVTRVPGGPEYWRTL